MYRLVAGLVFVGEIGVEDRADRAGIASRESNEFGRDVMGSEMVVEGKSLRRFTRAVEALEDDKEAAGHETE